MIETKSGHYQPVMEVKDLSLEAKAKDLTLKAKNKCQGKGVNAIRTNTLLASYCVIDSLARIM